MRETWVQGVKIEAENAGEAIAAVINGDGENLEDSFEYSDTRDPTEWTLNEIKE